MRRATSNVSASGGCRCCRGRRRRRCRRGCCCRLFVCDRVRGQLAKRHRRERRSQSRQPCLGRQPFHDYLKGARIAIWLIWLSTWGRHVGDCGSYQPGRVRSLGARAEQASASRRTAITCVNGECALGSRWPLWLAHAPAPTNPPIVATTIVNHRITQSKPSVPRSLYQSLLRLACIFVFLFFSSPHCNHLIERVEPPWVVSSLPPRLRISSHYRLVSRLQRSSPTDRPPLIAPSSFISLQVRVRPSSFTALRLHRSCLPSSRYHLLLALTHARRHDR
jgi:hypothetical protein